MANALYDSAREAYLTGAMNWMADDIRFALVRGYTFNATHTSLAAVVAAGGTLVSQTGSAATGKSATGGVADADDVLFSAVASGAACQSVVVYRDGASDALRSLIAFFDTGAGLPVTPTGSDITIVWDSGANRIFKL